MRVGLLSVQEKPRRKSQTLNFSEEGFPVVRPLGWSRQPLVNDTQENYDNSGACYACVKQSTGPTPAWLKFDRQVGDNQSVLYIESEYFRKGCMLTRIESK